MFWWGMDIAKRQQTEIYDDIMMKYITEKKHMLKGYAKYRIQYIYIKVTTLLKFFLIRLLHYSKKKSINQYSKYQLEVLNN